MERDFSAEYQTVANVFAKRVSQQLSSVVRSVTLFGSVARGQADPDSDIDILVVVDSDDPKMVRAVYELALDVELEHQTPLAVKVFNQTRMQELVRLKTPFTTAVRREGKPLWTRKS